jgi:hypothetical protein
MQDHTDCKRGYHRFSKAWYADTVREEKGISVMVGMYHPDGGTSGEFEFKWVPLAGALCCQLQAFEDSWSALAQFQDLLAEMAKIDSQEIQEPEFCEMLDKLGILDITAYERDKPKNSLK